MNTILDLTTVAGLVLGLKQVVQAATNLPDKFGPLLELVLGVAVALLYVGITREASLLGIFAGLSAAGLWTGAKTIGLAAKREPTPPTPTV